MTVCCEGALIHPDLRVFCPILRASVSFPPGTGWSAACRGGFSLWQWPQVRVQHGETTSLKCLARNSLRWDECSLGWRRGKRDRPNLLNHHPDLCPDCAHSGWCDSTRGHTPTGSYVIYHWHDCGNNRDDPNHQGGEKREIETHPLTKATFYCLPPLCPADESYWRLITCNRVQQR